VVVEFKSGKIIVTPHEVVVKLDGEHRVTMQAQIDAISLIGKGANVIAANGSETKWSIKLDSEEQLQQIADQVGCQIQ